MPDSLILAPGSHLGKYEILAAIGSGGMGEVYKAHDSRLGRDVAIKILPRHLHRDSDALARFEREAKAVSALNHPHILTIHEISKARIKGERWLTPFIVTEFIDGETLRARLAKEISLKTHFEQLAQAADALAKAHAAGIVHRDLKPENIMVNSDGYAKLLDFGLAKLMAPLSENDMSDLVTAPLRTSENLVIGTSGYMSPEQVHGSNVGLRSDIFSFGCILYEVVAGRRPFEAETNVEILYKILHVEPPALSSDTPVEVRDLISCCLKKDPAERSPSMRDVAERLRHIAGSFDHLVTRPPRTSAAGRSSVRARSLAVLPFENASDDPEMEYLSDGLTESVIHNLSQVRRLRVMARSTVFTYKGRGVTPQQVGSELNVASVVTGKVQKIHGHLIANIELVSTRDGSQIWGKRYEKQFSDIMAMQEEVATQISAKLKVELSDSERRRLARRPARKSAAYELYLKGRYYAVQRTPESLHKSVQCFEEAVATDSRFALAHSGLADAYLILAAKSFIDPETGYPKVAPSARKAIALDPLLAEPHATLGLMQCLYERNLGEAEKEFLRALALDPNYSSAYHWYAEFLTTCGRHEEAISNALIALDLDPLSLLINVHVADTLHFAGRYEEAIDRCRRTIDLDPRYIWTYLVLGRTHDAMGNYPAAIDAFRKAVEMSGRLPELLAGLGHACAMAGDAKEAIALLKEIEERSPKGYVSPQFVAEVLIGLGEVDKALDQLEIFFRHPSGELAQLLVGPKFAVARSHPRYQSLAREFGLESATPVRTKKRKGRAAAPPS